MNAAMGLLRRGYHAVYRENEVNHCPGCGRTHWHIGRSMAECAFCNTALPMDASFTKGSNQPVIMRRGNGGGSIK